MPALFLKPDALGHSSRHLSGQAAAAFLLCLASEFDRSLLSQINSPSVLQRAARAHEQFNERRHSETEFGGRLHSLRKIATHLVSLSRRLQTRRAITMEALVALTLRGLAFKSVNIRKHRLTIEEVKRIYEMNDMQLERRLVRYLVGQRIVIYSISGRQSIAALQAMKTYLRHAFLNRRKNRYLLRNLVHVCGRRDTAFVANIARRYSPPT